MPITYNDKCHTFVYLRSNDDVSRYLLRLNKELTVPSITYWSIDLYLTGLLAMTLLGTVGNAYNELADVLRFSQGKHSVFVIIMKNNKIEPLS